MGLAVVSPAMCTVVVGIGLTPDDIERESAVAGTMANLRAGDERREARFAIDARFVCAALDDITALGARVLGGPSVDLGALRTAAKSSRVLVFICHYREALQLGPRMVPLAEVVDAIGLHFDGVADLGACVTAAPVAAIKQAGSRADWIGYVPDNRLDVRTSVVRAVQRVLRKRPASYIDVFSSVVQELNFQALGVS